MFRHYFPLQPLDATAESVAIDILTALGGYRHDRLLVEVYNEVARQNTTEYAPLLRDVTFLLHRAGVKVAGPSWSTGDYDAEHWEHLRSMGWLGVDAIAVHAYWGNERLTPWNALRYRRFWKPGDPPVIITECGRDKVEGGLGGWKLDGISAEQYLEELTAYDAALSHDAYVIGGTVFSNGPFDDWRQFDVDNLVASIPAATMAPWAGTLPSVPIPQPTTPSTTTRGGAGMTEAQKAAIIAHLDVQWGSINEVGRVGKAANSSVLLDAERTLRERLLAVKALLT